MGVALRGSFGAPAAPTVGIQGREKPPMKSKGEMTFEPKPPMPLKMELLAMP